MIDRAKKTIRAHPIQLGRSLALKGLLVCASLAAAQGQAGAPAPTRAEMEDFLHSAKIVKRKDISVGVTQPQRATLTDGRFTHDAHFQTVDISKTEFKGAAGGTELDFRDSYKFNIAAYRLDKLLGLNMIPVSVERRVEGKNAALTWWVDDVQMMELDRYKKKISVPPQRLLQWNDQMYQVRVFNELVYNTDANLGNLLITNDWGLCMIDFTRAFRNHKELRTPENLTRIDRRFYDGLRNLNEERLISEVGPYLTRDQIKALLARRDLIVKFFDEQIAERGEAAVICNNPGH
jgi:hypothetical protein